MKTFYKKNIQLNTNLIRQKNLNNQDIERISKLHSVKECFKSLMEKESDVERLRYFSKLITQIDFQLQKLWKFEQDITHHRFWELPKCDCPKSDNNDVCGLGHRFINNNCVLHGNKN